MAVRGETVELIATFYDQGNLFDPSSITMRVLLNNVVKHGPVTYPGTITRLSTGLFRYDWAIPIDAALGVYVVEWSAVMPGSAEPVVGFDIVEVKTEADVSTSGLYCTVPEARAAGAVGTDAQIVESIRIATHRIEKFTGDYFTPRVLTVVARVGGDGRAMLPHRLTSAASVTEVMDDHSQTVLATATWRASSSVIPGAVDSVNIGRDWVGTNILVVGLEPWAVPRTSVERVRVTGTFGYSAIPPIVVWACARLAAALSRDVVQDTDADPLTPPPATGWVADPEGNVLPVVPPFTEPATVDDLEAQRTTGDRKVDGALVPYRRTQPLLAGV